MRAGLAAIDAVEIGAYAIARALDDRMAGLALGEGFSPAANWAASTAGAA
jgi:hypothetical protein